MASSQHTKVKVVRSTGYKLIAGLAKKRLALMQHVVQDDGNPVTPVQKKHVKQPATETTMNLMDDIDAITAKGKGGIVVHMMSIANLIKIFKYKCVAFLFGAAGWGLHARRQTSNGGSARKK